MGFRSTSTSWPARFFQRPATITLSTLARLAWNTTAATGSCTGCMLSMSARMSTRSACLPGASVPMRPSWRSMRAPSTVTQANASAAPMVLVGGMLPCACRNATLSRLRWMPSATRACVSMSPLSTDSRSTPSEGARPSWRSRPVSGWPWPCDISLSAAAEKLMPSSQKRASSTSSSAWPCTMLICSPSKPSRSSTCQPPGVRAAPPPWCSEAMSPSSRAMPKSWRATSSVE